MPGDRLGNISDLVAGNRGGTKFSIVTHQFVTRHQWLRGFRSKARRSVETSFWSLQASLFIFPFFFSAFFSSYFFSDNGNTSLIFLITFGRSIDEARDVNHDDV